MTVHVLIPVFNRLAMTRRVLESLRTQQLDQPLRIVVIDDGSTDSTGEYLSAQADVTVLKGDGSLWWGGAIEMGLRHVLSLGEPDDWVLLVNNDTFFGSDFVQCLLEAARAHAPAAVGSVICNEQSPEELLSIGAELDTWNLLFRDRLQERRRRDVSRDLHRVDALSGRGTIYPLQVFRTAGTMRPRLLPHYYADYEFAIRARKAGYRLLVSEKAAVFSADEAGQVGRPDPLVKRLFALRSKSYLPAYLTFWWTASSAVERLSLLPRFARRFVKVAS